MKRLICRLIGHKVWAPMLGNSGMVRWTDPKTGRRLAFCHRCESAVPAPEFP